ncbi:MAG: hypothetical protein GKS00_22765 [Alphaproteobacteria bacterium]|nr:hypothetical protein [Alphaproteobacteria bacterium]
MENNRNENENSNRPIDKINDGHLKASIWRNEGEKGAFYSTTFSRSYKDSEGKYRDTQSFTGTDLLKLSELARGAYARTNELRREDHEQSRENRREDFKEERGNSNQSQRRDYNK